MTEMTNVTSSNIESIGYRDNRLYVKFKSGATYSYKDVPAEVYEALKIAESKGKFINENIKSKYGFEKVKINESK